MRGIKLILCLLVVSLFAFAQQKPEPFGLKLGVGTKQETLSVIKREGGRVVKEGYKIIKGDIVNPNVEGVEVEGLPVDNLISATLWFYKGKLYKIDYTFPLSMKKEEFAVLHNQLRSKYGAPKKFVEPWLSDGLAEWNFGDVRIQLIAPWVSRVMYLTYEHIPLSREVQKSDQEVFQKETSKPKKGL